MEVETSTSTFLSLAYQIPPMILKLQQRLLRVGKRSISPPLHNICVGVSDCIKVE